MSKERPGPILFAKTIRETTPWGNLYVTLNFDGIEPFEVFLHIGKSGSEITAMTEAMARLISIGLRRGCPLKDLINTLKGLSGKEYWMFDCDDNRVVRSLPEAVALLLEKLNTPSDSATPQVQTAPKEELPAASEAPEIQPALEVPKPSRKSEVICPECGAPMELMGGCSYCLSCGYSPCK